MRIVIDISKDRYDEIMSMDWKNCRLIFDEEIRAIHDGKALVQEPCEDCISRQAAIRAIEALQRPIMREVSDYYQFKFSGMSEAREVVVNLPSVTPAKNTGHWIYTKAVTTGEILWSECSECKSGERGCAKRMKYCPSCGSYNGGGKNEA